ncbi:MAG TPA: ABC transporter permease, partial [Isosphaeraceae bacterium]|nr:ABC transporter permease [Isosphaeraceae bacterium]
FSITPQPGWVGLNLREFWAYRELLYFLTWRDIKVRYKQTTLGAAWAVLQPVMTMAIFTIFFGRLAGIETRTGGVPYPLFVFSALLPWMFFANAMTACGNSLVGSSSLVTKVYFPRLVIPLSTVAAGLVDLAISFVVLLALLAFYQVPPAWPWLLVPLFLAAVVLAACGMGMLLSALTVSYRDFRYVVPFLSQIWMFLTPVMYPGSIVPARWQRLYYLNPMAGLIDGFRAVLLGQPPEWSHVLPSLIIAILILLAGAAYFHKVEGDFADVI